ncbi:tRNA (guanosine(46)-N7)-methyltransferase TrmB [Methylocystis sp. MJC1]|jgi:tRNA (guanine-N7-)-methyltransferase|uniref:tRNA (guanosine(46)-N7)-methyltransferase TrmB n=1 Tax=Methylocystis sp. MJC1 TaxID=2654282 RepID=UPI0013EB1B7B|nr:tRNA (guanosine(46)-N7)-methyltransferase TrmB [Methylocystis sp. MJC1]KAF2992768.1 tRNA (guanine-N(7)-)-methyltransferase [Methylocystis sp. MJC1]MBU6526730.1 tRNA (guanosine(46)-N7)-methyltransferase TrmB [Methylocystis sp. MJC1]UZX13167.1 tRNA (guanosine(46)-N7)-methyltransferase TrmB [Methylocystis sp. MJC1]
MNEHPPHRRLYGRSKGKALRQHQSELVADLLPRLALDLSAPLPLRPGRETRLEIGFGGGEHLIEVAAREPDVDFFGCEPFINGMAKLLAGIEARGLTNIRLYRGDAAEVLDRLPDASLSRVYLFYPDPWPKRRHRKRRFVSPENLARLARVMQPGAELRFATDIDDYAAWTLARLRVCDAFRWQAEAAQDWRAPWEGWTQTKYEAKAMAAGRRPVYLTFVRQAE